MLSDLAVRFAEVRDTFAQADKLLKNKIPKALSSYIFPTPAFSKEEAQLQKEALTDTRIAQPSMGATNMAALSLLKAMAIKPDMVAGHSYGEYIALCAAGYYDFENLLNISAERGELLAQAENNGQISNGAMAAVSCSPEELTKYLPNKSANVVLANYNSPNQIVIAGPIKEIETAIELLQNQGVVARRLAVSQAFHTPSMSTAANKLATALRQIEYQPANTDAYSNRHGYKYHRQPNGIEANLAAHTVEPVNFVEQINTMYNDGARIFLEVGAGSVLTNLAQSILESHPDAICISLDRQGRDGVTNLLHALAQLAVNGVHIDWQRLYQNRIDVLTPFLDSYNAPDTSLSRGNKKLIYLVNGAGVRPKDSSPTANTVPRPQSDSALASKGSSPSTSSVPLKTTIMPSNNTANKLVPTISNQNLTKSTTVGINGNSVEQVMVNFQQAMQEMANSFLETQQRVMLAYLESQGNGFSAADNVQRPLSSLSRPEYSFEPTLADQSQSTEIVDQLQSPELQIAENTSVNEPAAEMDTEHLINSLVEIVAERTGYPVDMIDPTLDLEADLGIDSIKRVEILNKFRRLLPENTQQQLEAGIEELAGTRTLQGIIDWFRGNQNTEVKPAEQESVDSDKQIHADGNGGNGKHDNLADIKLEEHHGQQYIEAASRTSSHALVSNSSHVGQNGANGKGEENTKEIQEGNTIRGSDSHQFCYPSCPAVKIYSRKNKRDPQ